MRIISSSKMNAKISRSLSTLLGTIDLSDIKCKPGLVVLYASAPVGSKLVSIVEVVKREIEAEGKKNGGKVGRWWQYSGVGEEIVEVRPQGKGGKKGKGGSSSQPIELDDEEGEKMDLDAEEKEGGKEDGDGDEEESEPYFEPLKKVEQQVGKKFKAGAVLTVYLSRVPVKELEKVYGVQTNSKT